LNKTTTNKVENKMRKYCNQMTLDYLKEKQKRREESEAYEEAFNKLSNEERKIINSVELKISTAKLEELMFIRIKEEKKQIEELTKMIEDDRIKTERCNNIGRASFCIGVLAYVGLTIITR